MAFAENTQVPVERSRAEIETMLRRYGASQFVSGWDADKAVVGFSAQARQLRFVLKMPAKDEKRFLQTHHKNRHFATTNSKEQATRLYEQEVRRLWRALALSIKAKLEAVESGIETFEEAFMPHIVLPDGSTVGQFISPQLERVYAGGEMPRLLPALPARRDE
jgi:hypothetical protein